MKSRLITTANKQQGIALITSLIILLILTIIGVTAVNMTSLNEKMAFNTQDRQLAGILVQSSLTRFATVGNLPAPQQPGTNANVFPITAADVVDARDGSAQITYIDATSGINVPRIGKAGYFSSGNNVPVFETYVVVSTRAGTTARSKYGQYFVPHTQN